MSEVQVSEVQDFSVLPTSAEQVLARLGALGIAHETINHPPVFTVAEAKHVRALTKGGHVKNLFLRNKKGAMWLVTLAEDKRVDLKALGEALGAGKLSFGSSERLRDHLGVFPGSVTALALINDTAGHVTFVLDEDFLVHETVNVHPFGSDVPANSRPGHQTYAIGSLSGGRNPSADCFWDRPPGVLRVACSPAEPSGFLPFGHPNSPESPNASGSVGAGDGNRTHVLSLGS